MNENTVGGRNGDSGTTGTKGGTEQVKEHLRAAKDAASDTLRSTTQQAKGWSRDQFQTLQERVEAEPYRATAWALGIGFVAGVLITALAKSGKR